MLFHKIMFYVLLAITMSVDSELKDSNDSPIADHPSGTTPGEDPYVGPDPVFAAADHAIYPGDLLCATSPTSCGPPRPCPGSMFGSGSTDSGVCII